MQISRGLNKNGTLRRFNIIEKKRGQRYDEKLTKRCFFGINAFSKTTMVGFNEDSGAVTCRHTATYRLCTRTRTSAFT